MLLLSILNMKKFLYLKLSEFSEYMQHDALNLVCTHRGTFWEHFVKSFGADKLLFCGMFRVETESVFSYVKPQLLIIFLLECPVKVQVARCWVAFEDCIIHIELLLYYLLLPTIYLPITTYYFVYNWKTTDSCLLCLTKIKFSLSVRYKYNSSFLFSKFTAAFNEHPLSVERIGTKT